MGARVRAPKVPGPARSQRQQEPPLFTINLPPKKALTVRCSACKSQVTVKENKAPAPFKMAFNHPKQEIKQPCPQCGGEMVWLPEEAVIADAASAS